MLLQKIQTGALLILSALVMICCSKNYDPSFFKGEWLSDSLVTKENDHWREFLYFDNGYAARTTVWGRQYLLNKNLKVKDLQLYDRDKPLFRIKVIDSNKIAVEGKDYYGSFTRSDAQLYPLKTAVAIAEKTEKQRQKLFGKWKMISFKTMALSGLQEDKMIADHMRDVKLEDIPLKEINSVDFKYDIFSVQHRDKTTSFEYSAEPDKIDFYSGDMIFSFTYYFQKEQLVLEFSTTPMFRHMLMFEKAR